MPPPSMDDQRRVQHGGGVGVSVGGDSEKSSNNNDDPPVSNSHASISSYSIISIIIILLLTCGYFNNYIPSLYTSVFTLLKWWNSCYFGYHLFKASHNRLCCDRSTGNKVWNYTKDAAVLSFGLFYLWYFHPLVLKFIPSSYLALETVIATVVRRLHALSTFLVGCYDVGGRMGMLKTIVLLSFGGGIDMTFKSDIIKSKLDDIIKSDITVQIVTYLIIILGLGIVIILGAPLVILLSVLCAMAAMIVTLVCVILWVLQKFIRMVYGCTRSLSSRVLIACCIGCALLTCVYAFDGLADAAVVSAATSAASIVASAAGSVASAVGSSATAVGSTVAAVGSTAVGLAVLEGAASLANVGDVESSNEDEDEDEDVVEEFYEHDNFDKQNDSQSHAVQIVLDYCFTFAKMLSDMNLLLLPLHFFQMTYFVLSLLPQLKDNTNAKIYYHRTLKKCGMTGNGWVRWLFYNRLGYILTIIDLDTLNLEENNFVVKFVCELCQNFCKIDQQRVLENSYSIQDAIDQEASYLPFTSCLIMYMIGYNGCPCLGGIHCIRGTLKKVCLLVIESGVQLLLLSLGVELDKRTMPHEWLRGSLKWVSMSHKLCASGVMLLIDELKHIMVLCTIKVQGMTYIEYIMKNGIVMIGFASWAPDLGQDDGSGYIILTDVIMNLIFGDKHWGDAFGNEKPVKRGTGDPYDAEQFDKSARERARDRISDWLKTLKGTVGGFGALNRNAAAFKYSSHTVESCLDDHGFKHFPTIYLLDIQVYMFRESDIHWPVFVLLHGPPCYMADSSIFQGRMNTNASHIERMQDRCMDMYAIYLLQRMLGEPNSNFIVDRDLRHYSIFGNLLFAHAVYVQLVCNFHIARIYACPVFKNLLLGLSCNAFDEDKHNLAIQNGDHGVVSKSARGKLARYNETANVRNRHFVTRVLACLSTCVNNMRENMTIRSAARLIKSNGRSRNENGGLDGIKSRLTAVAGGMLTVAYDALHGGKTEATRKRTRDAMAGGDEKPDRGVGVKDNGKIYLSLCLNNGSSQSAIYAAFGSIAAGNAARKACLEYKNKFEKENGLITNANRECVKQFMRQLALQKQQEFHPTVTDIVIYGPMNNDKPINSKGVASHKYQCRVFDCVKWSNGPNGLYCCTDHAFTCPPDMPNKGKYWAVETTPGSGRGPNQVNRSKVAGTDAQEVPKPIG